MTGDSETTRTILALIEGQGALTRRQLSEQMGLPITTVNSAITPLLSRHVIQEKALDRTRWAGRGRPPQVLTRVRKRMVVVVVMGHHDLRAAVVSTDGSLAAHRVVPFSPFELDEITGSVAELAEDVLRASGAARGDIAGTVLALPRPYRPGQPSLKLQPGPDLVGSTAPAWLTTDPAPSLGERLRMPVMVENDANLAALGEATHGAGRGLEDLIYLKIVPGLGAGVVTNGTLVRGAHGFAGEIAHLQHDEAGPPCRCGNRGCLLQLINMRGVIAQLKSAYPDAGTVEDIIGLAALGEPGVHRLFGDLGHALGPFLSVACLFVDPQMIVVDGSLGSAAQPLIDGLRSRMSRSMPSGAYGALRFETGRLGEQAELFGAAALAVGAIGPFSRPVTRTKQVDQVT